MNFISRSYPSHFRPSFRHCPQAGRFMSHWSWLACFHNGGEGDLTFPFFRIRHVPQLFDLPATPTIVAADAYDTLICLRRNGTCSDIVAYRCSDSHARGSRATARLRPPTRKMHTCMHAQPGGAEVLLAWRPRCTKPNAVAFRATANHGGHLPQTAASAELTDLQPHLRTTSLRIRRTKCPRREDRPRSADTTWVPNRPRLCKPILAPSTLSNLSIRELTTLDTVCARSTR